MKKYLISGFFLFFCGAACAQNIYKWTDENGRTHYSEKKEDAGKTKAVELKVKSEPMSTQAPNPSAQNWQEEEGRFKQRQIEKLNPKQIGPPADTKPKALSNAKSDGTDSSRCNLAKDVMSGAVKHRNGKPTDKYDRDIAENDIRAYCH